MRISSFEQLNTKEIQSSKSTQNSKVPYFGLSKMNAGNLGADVFDDGKISNKSKLQHFVKGVVSPITSLLSSPKNMLMGAGMIAAGGLLCAAVPTIMPLLIAGGIVGGAFQLGKGIYNASTAKTDGAAEKAWENIGAGTFAVGSSALGAKKSLKSAGIKNVDDMNIAKATIQCFKESKSSVTKSISMVKNKTAFTNLKSTFIAPENYSEVDDLNRLKKLGFGKEKLEELKKYSEMLHAEGEKAINTDVNGNSIEELKAVLPDEVAKTLTQRVKSASSIKDKLIKRMEDKKTIESLDDARAAIGDLVGTRVTVNQLDDAQMEALVNSLGEGLRNGKIQFTDVDNYHGKGIEPYFSEDQLDLLREAANSAKCDFSQFEGSGSWDPKNSKLKGSGYTTAQINVKYSNGALGEFQIRGEGVQGLAEIEHIPYDLRTSKDLSKGKALLKTLYEPLKSKITVLSDEGYSKYNEYLTALYKYYRSSEKGVSGLKMPEIKDYLNGNKATLFNKKAIKSLQNIDSLYDNMLKTLDIGNIDKIHGDASWLEKIPRTQLIDALRGGIATYIDEKSVKDT